MFCLYVYDIPSDTLENLRINLVGIAGLIPFLVAKCFL